MSDKLSIEHRPIYRVRPEDRAIAMQFLNRPLAPPSPDLLRLLSRLRWEPIAGKYVLVCTDRHSRWILGQIPDERGKPIRLIPEHVFNSKEDAERAVFRLRWEKLTGEELA